MQCFLFKLVTESVSLSTLLSVISWQTEEFRVSLDMAIMHSLTSNTQIRTKHI